MSDYTNTIPGFMRPEELVWLHAEASKYQSIAEVGAWAGKSTHALLSACPGTVHAVDHWTGYMTGGPEVALDIFEQFQGNVGHFPNLVIHRGDSADTAGLFAPKSIEMVFIDADHSYEGFKRDFEAWLPVASKLICGHDCDGGQPGGAFPGVHRYLAERGVKYSIYHTIWYLYL